MELDSGMINLAVELSLMTRCPMNATGTMSSTPQTDGHPMGETPLGQPGTSH